MILFAQNNSLGVVSNCTVFFVHAGVKAPSTGVVDIGAIGFAASVFAADVTNCVSFFMGIRTMFIFRTDRTHTAFFFYDLTRIFFNGRFPKGIDVGG